MLILKKVPAVNQEQIVLFRRQLSIREKIEQFFSSEPELPMIFQGRRMYEDVLILDPNNLLEIGKKIDTAQAQYSSKEPDYHKMINHTVYKIYGLIPYGILDDAKLCSVDRFEIDLDRCWKSSY